jgi:hypothetical protein
MIADEPGGRGVREPWLEPCGLCIYFIGAGFLAADRSKETCSFQTRRDNMAIITAD